MAVRQDKVQISIAFLTDEGKEYAKLIERNKQFEKELKATQRAGGDVTATLNQMAAAGEKAGKIDLSKVAPAQLNARAKQLQQIIALIPQSAPQYKVLNDELAQINGQLGSIRESQRGSTAASQTFFQTAMAGARGFLAALGPIAIALIGVQSAFDAVKALFNIGTDAEALQTKMTAVFGESTKAVEDFADKNAAAIGLSRREYKGLATDVGDLLTPMGFTKETAAELSVELVNQAGILSRWTKGKVDTKTATEVLNKALLGERDALNSLGIDIKDSLIQAELKAKGLDKLTGESLRQAEALITLEQITKQSSNANAAFAKGTEDLQEKKARLRARIMEIVDSAGNALVPVFNKVLGAIIPVVEWVINFGTGLAQAWRNAETFRAVIAGAFAGVANAIAGVVRGIGQVADGFGELFSGNFSNAVAKFGEGLGNLNPIGVGINLATGVKDGFNSVKFPQPEIKADTEATQGEGRKLAGAFGSGYDAQFDKIKSNSKKSAKQIADDQKEALQTALKEVEANMLRQEIVLEAQRLAGQIDEREYGNALVEIKKATLAAQLKVYEDYAKAQTNEALKLKNDLARLEADTAQAPVASVATLPGRKIGRVETGADETNERLRILDLSQGIIQEKLKQSIRLEEELELRRMETKRRFLDEELKILRESSAPQTEAIQQREQAKADIEKEIGEQRLASERQRQEVELQVLQIGVQQTGDLFGAFAEILSRDEKIKRKHAETIKAFQKAQITLNLISEVSGIFANAQESPVAKLLGPIAGNVLAGVQAGIATARAFVAMNKVDQAKFERGQLLQFGRGTKMGFFGGNLHSHGGTQVVASDGSHFEVERDEMFAVVNRKNSNMLRSLSNLNAFGGNGVPFFERGGTVGLNTTPNFRLAAPTAPAAPDNSALLMGLMAEMSALRSELGTWQSKLQVNLVYSDVQAVGKIVNNISSQAAL